jgi:hypothetical protein
MFHCNKIHAHVCHPSQLVSLFIALESHQSCFDFSIFHLEGDGINSQVELSNKDLNIPHPLFPSI